MNSQPPYDQLHIYEVEGDARSALGRDMPGYLGLWLEAGTSFIFFAQPAPAQVEAILARDPGLKLLAQHHLSYEQWQGGLAMEPVSLPGLTVVPAWQDSQVPAGGKLLRLDPGLVFGNGLHPTTRHSLELLLLRANEGPLGRVLDLGCGTGILGLAALLLGAQSALAVDMNPLCVQTSQRNAALNNLPLEVVEGAAQEYVVMPAQVVLSNLHWEVQEKILARPEHLKGKRDLILSGIMRSQRPLLEERLRQLDYAIIEQREAEDTWFTLWARAAS